MDPTFKIFIGFLIGAIPYFCYSQSTRFQVGIEGGPSLSIIRSDEFVFPSKDCVIGLGYTVGVAFQVNLNNKLAVRTNLSFERKGYQSTSGNFHYRFDYLVLPILFHINLGKKNRSYFNVGPYFGYLFSTSSKYYHWVDHDDEWMYKKYDLGISLGLGFNIPLYHQLWLTIELRDNLGLYNIQYKILRYDHFGNPYGDYGKSYTNSTVLQFGIVYNFGKIQNKQ